MNVLVFLIIAVSAISMSLFSGCVRVDSRNEHINHIVKDP